jgi:hypothetical protein
MTDGRTVIGSSRLQQAGPLGVAVLLVASTLNGLAAELAVAGFAVTIRPDQVVLVLLGPLIVASLVASRAGFDRPLVHLPVIVLLVANTVASVLHSPLAAMSLQGVALMAVYVGMYFTPVILLRGERAWTVRLPVLLVGLGLVQAALGLGAFFLFSAGIPVGGVAMGQVVGGAPSVHTTFWEGNLLGAFLAVVCALIATSLVLAPDRRPRLARLGAFCLCGLTLVLTLTRAAWLALILVVLALGAERLVATRSPRAMLRALFPVLAGVAIVITISLLVLEPLLTRPGSEESVLGTRARSLWSPGRPETSSAVAFGSYTAIAGRLILLQLGARAWTEAPLLGHGTFAGEAIGQRYWLSSAVQAAYDTGLVGLAALATLQGLVILIPLRLSFRVADPRLRALLLGCAAANGSLAFTSLFSSFLWVGFPWVFMGITVALSDAVRAGLRREEAVLRVAGPREPEHWLAQPGDLVPAGRRRAG